MDDFSLFFIGLILLAGIVVVVLSATTLKIEDDQEEYYLMLLLAILGASVLVASDQFASFFIGLEILSLSLYALIGYPQARLGSLEASIKYLILAAVSSSFLLFGMALVYAEVGRMDFPGIAVQLSLPVNQANPVLLVGLGLMIVGFGFKLALVPFHMWTADVYQGTPIPITALIATISKGSIFAVLLKFYGLLDLRTNKPVYLTLTIIAIASMLVGNLAALFQNHVKRLLAYSSVAHMGYLLVPLLAGGALANLAFTFYIIAYFVTMLGAFGVISMLSSRDHEADDLVYFRGLFWRYPWLAGVFMAMLLSLAGIPLTAGFIGKFYLVTAGIGSASWPLVFVLVVSSVIGLFYYLRVILAMFAHLPESESAREQGSHLPVWGSLILAVLTVLLVWLGVYPSPITRFIQTIVASL